MVEILNDSDAISKTKQINIICEKLLPLGPEFTMNVITNLAAYLCLHGVELEKGPPRLREMNKRAGAILEIITENLESHMKYICDERIPCDTCGRGVALRSEEIKGGIHLCLICLGAVRERGFYPEEEEKG